MLKKVSSLVLAVVVALITCQIMAIAEQDNRNTAKPLYTQIVAIDANISCDNGKVVCRGLGKGLYADTTTHLLVTLQSRAKGTNTWRTVCMWGATASGTATARVNQERAVSSGYDYRVLVKCTIKDADGAVLETGSAYSNIVSY